MSKHTQGPWKAEINTLGVREYTDKTTGEKFEIADFRIQTSDGDSFDIAEVTYRTNSKYWCKDLQEVKANAQLIAAAPDMLEALKLLLNGDDYQSEASIAAINKAEGITL